ncbi:MULTISPECIES: hypothetical protein [Geobacillus]|uniref:DUF2188 domain-containing protein n=1 Tax=Geobacillus subterraneus TaxID=129338 RepID=A0A679FPM9_9BACL|nr:MULTISPECIES: hypothetical protein [Geobacillus]KYD28966.1 hypothetical protein B4113_3332 [Geobacillus sp. B4113_201601]NNV07962.1 hypothetical protein [Geobacillus sp. MMMUD3]TWG30556.1 hypothetical protein GC56T2_1715 [Geobacillus sp. C56-T2]BBW96187.1 hypothetical protein GsuE55_10200 [Geobacillus subterraneus]
MKQYVFSFYTVQGKTIVWEEAITASGMMEAFSKAQQLLIKHKREKGVPIRVKYKGVCYRHTDIA